MGADSLAAVAGIGIGAASVIAPTYIAEVSPAYIRGRLGSMHMAIVLGIFLALLADAALAASAGGASTPLWFGPGAWRWMLLVEALPALIYGSLALGVPESPRYLVAKGDRSRRGRAEPGEEHDNDGRTSSCRRSRRSCAPSTATLQRSARPARAAAGGVDRYRAVGVPAVRRHQRDLLLLVDAVAFGGVSDADSFMSRSPLRSSTCWYARGDRVRRRIGRKPLPVIGSAGMAVSLAVMACASRTYGSDHAQPASPYGASR